MHESINDLSFSQHKHDKSLMPLLGHDDEMNDAHGQVFGSTPVNLLAQNIDIAPASSEDSIVESQMPRVLVVDDCMINIMAVSSILDSIGFKYDTSNDGLEAIEAVKKRRALMPSADMYKLIFMDYSMPNCNGCDATREIRDYLSQQDVSIPYICCLTAY